ncbi:phage gpG-like protein [Sphingobium jiangsuense]|uniref:Phage gpG-like protein n=2 Tax=Sphingobium jiangsuense TaxID=870476 RepID=A0A7W6BMG3_9SPHN|nr:HK97 gp10 family phage protein [Sphingobium jiangsuense]MBB3927827.1 phage gpG-like protein [Sphingobium jiangsuense]
MKIAGMKAHKARLKRIRGPQMIREVGKAIKTASEIMEKAAQISITTGSTAAKGQHRPSAPGTPPNNDLGGLADSIESVMTGPLAAEVSANARYAAIQEFGGTVNNPGGQPYFIKNGEFIPVSKSSPHAGRLPKTKPHQITLPERPYMRPAAQKTRPKAQKLVAAAVKKVANGGTL